MITFMIRANTSDPLHVRIHVFAVADVERDGVLLGVLHASHVEWEALRSRLEVVGEIVVSDE